MYAPFGAGVLVGPRDAFADGDPFLAGGGAVDLVDLDEVVWTEPPDREEAGSPNVVGAVALGAAIDELGRIGWDAIAAHDDALARHLHDGLRAIPGIRVLGPGRAVAPRSPPSPSTASRTPCSPPASAPSTASACATAASAPTRTCSGSSASPPPRSPTTGTPCSRATAARSRAPCGPAPASPPPPTSIDRFLAAVAAIAADPDPPVPYDQDLATGDWWPVHRRRGLDGPATATTPPPAAAADVLPCRRPHAPAVPACARRHHLGRRPAAALAGLLPALRGLGPDDAEQAARQFDRIAWPAFAVLVLAGIWNIVGIDVGDTSTEYQVTLFVKLVLVALTGVGAAVHRAASSKPALAIGGACAAGSAPSAPSSSACSSRLTQGRPGGRRGS